MRASAHDIRNRFFEILNQSQDLIVRYYLLDTPEESIASRKSWLSKYHHHLAPVGLEDHQAITRLLARRLKSPENGLAPLTTPHAKYMLQNFFDTIKKEDDYPLCIPIIERACEFLWRELSRPESEDHRWQHVTDCGFAFLGMVKYVSQST